jgi:hypothetical protein
VDAAYNHTVLLLAENHRSIAARNWRVLRDRQQTGAKHSVPTEMLTKLDGLLLYDAHA